MTPEEVQQEQDGVELLAGMMGGDVGLEEARRVLRKHKGDVQKAADAMLGGDRGQQEEGSSNQDNKSFIEPAASSSGTRQAVQTQGSSGNIIDLTAEDDYTRPNRWDSIRSRQQEVKFGPSERPADPAWQMVTTSNAAGETNASRDDRSLNDAIQASLADFNTDELEVFPVEETVRQGNRPIALRTAAPGVAYAALAAQALFMVPQVREAIAGLRLPDIEAGDSPQHTMWKLVELFTNLDLAQLSGIVDNDVVLAFNPGPWDGTTASLGEVTEKFIKSVALLVESQLNAQQAEDEADVCLFDFTHTQAHSRANGQFKIDKSLTHGSIVSVDANDGSSPPDLVSKLSANLSRYDGGIWTHDIIAEPSDVVIFKIDRGQSSMGGVSTKPSPELFSFPKILYLDRFLVKNLSLANQKRCLEMEMLTEIGASTKHKELITHFNDRDTIKDLRTSLYYYEHVAQSNGDLAREEAILRTKKKLQNILANMVQTVDEIEQRLEKLQHEVAVLYDCPELQNECYDLRAVLVHTGLPGRKQIYSYVQDSQGVWWKILDHVVTEVPEETVLTDPTGLHLSAGPYMLVYSRHLPEDVIKTPQTWPPLFVNTVQQANQHFLSMLPPDIAGKAGVAPSITEQDAIMFTQVEPEVQGENPQTINSDLSVMDVSDD